MSERLEESYELGNLGPGGTGIYIFHNKEDIILFLQIHKGHEVPMRIQRRIIGKTIQRRVPPL